MWILGVKSISFHMYILCSGTSVFRSCFSVWREKLFVLEYFGIVYNTYIYRRVAPAMYIMPENSNNEGRWTPKKHPPKYILRIKSSSKCVSMNDACVYAQCESISFDFLLVICQLNLLFAVFFVCLLLTPLLTLLFFVMRALRTL